MKPNQKIPVAHVFLSLNIGGMEKVGLDLIKNMDQEKYEHFVVCLDELGYFGEKLKEDGFPVFAFHKGQGYTFSLLLKLIRFFRKNNIRIVHTNNPAPHFWGGMAAFLAGVKIRIHTKHGRNFINIKKKVFINRLSALLSHRVVSVSRDSAELTKNIERVPERKISIILNGVDTDYFRKQTKNEALYKEFGIAPGKTVIGCISRFSTDKDYETLIKAFNEVLKEKANLVLLLVGDGETKKEMMALADKLQIKEKVIFSGFRSDILDLLNFLDIFILSTHTEGISISLLEAMATEKAVIATDVGGNGEIVEHGQNGCLVAENDVAGLKEMILYLLNDEHEKNRMAKAARKLVVGKFSLQKTVAQYEALYEEFLSGQ